MKIKQFIFKSKNINKSSYIWNMSGSMIMAFQSVIMLMILTRTVGIVEAGVFTIAYANANLFLNVGKYGMRNFQVSDAKNQFSFSEYLASRIFTVFLMIVFSFLYTYISAKKNNYNSEKVIVILLMCIFKVADAIEDVYIGYFQHKNRLDIPSKAMTLRLVITIVVFGVLLILGSSLSFSLFIACVVTYICLGIFIFFSTDYICLTKFKVKNIYLLLVACFSLFASNFLSFYIGNAPKYAIDSMLNDELQACYGFIAMPVFVVGLLNGFIFNPVIYKMTDYWEKREYKKFMKRLWIQVLIVAVISLCCVIGAYLLGIPVLSILYNTDLKLYKKELIILMIGGGMLGLSGLLTTIITIIRYQKCLGWIYAAVAVLAFILSPVMVRRYSITGAAIIYLALMTVLCGVLFIITLFGIMRGKKDSAYGKSV